MTWKDFWAVRDDLARESGAWRWQNWKARPEDLGKRCRWVAFGHVGGSKGAAQSVWVFVSLARP